MLTTIIIAAAWLAFAGLGAWIAAQKHRDRGEGMILGFLFGPLGALIEALLPVGKSPREIDPAPARTPTDWAEWAAIVVLIGAAVGIAAFIFMPL